MGYGRRIGPSYSLSSNVIQEMVGYFDAELGGHIQNAFHALAMDEKRGPFKPNLWTIPEPKNVESFSREVCQVWFRGSHSDVGGGAYRTELTNETLRWMMNRALSCGLKINAELIDEVEGKLYEHDL